MSSIKRKLGPFELEGRLGAGGMGTVYLATYTKTGQKVALKVLPPDLSGDEKLIARFAREMDILQKLRHPRIVRYFGGGKAGAQHFYAMELMTGGALEQALKKRGRISWEQTIDWGQQICEALQYAHENGIVHRDLKPANLFLGKDGELKLGDFGIARDQDATALTAAGRTVGTYAYMAPEQITGKQPITARTDLYALGCLLFQLLTGRTPYEAETPPEMMFKHVQEEPPRVMSLAVDCPIWLESVVMRLLNKKPDERYYDAMAVYVALDEVGRSVAEQASVTRQTAVGGATAVMTKVDQKELKQLIGSKRKKKKKKKKVPFYERASFLSACLLLLVGGISWALWPLSEDELFARAQPLMASENAGDWLEARRKYVQPMLDRYPDGRHASEARAFLDRVDMHQAETRALRAARLNREPESETERLFVEAWRYEQFGDRITAREKYSGLATLFAEKDDARPFVHLARRQIAAIDQAGGEDDRVEVVNAALRRAEDLLHRGELLKAQEIWRSVVSLYAGNQEFDLQLKYARARLDNGDVESLGFDPFAAEEEASERTGRGDAAGNSARR